MNLKPVIQSEVSQKEKNKYSYINPYIWNLETWYWWAFLWGSNRDTDIKNRLVDTVGQGKGGMKWESSTETYIIICKIDSQWESAVWHKELNLVLCDYMVGWGGMSEGGSRERETYVYLWLIRVDVWPKPTQHCKAVILQLKINKLKKNNSV